MENNPTINAEDIRLEKIDVVQTKLDQRQLKAHKNPDLKIAHHILHNLKDDRVKIELIINLLATPKRELLALQVDFHFNIKHLSNFYSLNDTKQPVFYGPLIATLVGMAYSTSRGILVEKLKTNDIHTIILPVVSPRKLLEGEN